MALLLNILKPRNELEEGGRKAAPVQQDEGEPEKVCPNCRKRTSISTLWANKMVCGCGYHFHMKARQRILMLSDKDSFRELFEGLHGDNPLSFPGYQRKLDTVRSASGEDEAVICGTTRISGIEVCIFAMEAHFMMGSMGSAVGEKITRLFETALAARMPVIGYVVSGGARMQEGLFSLMQMAKTSAAVKRHSDAGLLYISILTAPTTGGVTASFGMEADIILAEPGAAVGFAGRRVVEQTTRKALPKGFQTAEFVLEHGFIDEIVDRNRQRAYIAHLLAVHGRKGSVGLYWTP